MDQKSFSSGESPNDIENAIIEYLQNQEVEPKVHASKFKMTFEFHNEGQQGIKTQIKLSKIDD
jgi:hypothetical protein